MDALRAIRDWIWMPSVLLVLECADALRAISIRVRMHFVLLDIR